MSKLKRRRFTREFKIQVCLEIESGVKSQAEACREHNLSANTVSSWLADYREDPDGCFPAAPSENGSSNTSNEAKIKELEAALGRATMENELLKKANSALKKRYRQEQQEN